MAHDLLFGATYTIDLNWHPETFSLARGGLTLIITLKFWFADELLLEPNPL